MATPSQASSYLLLCRAKPPVSPHIRQEPTKTLLFSLQEQKHHHVQPGVKWSSPYYTQAGRTDGDLQPEVKWRSSYYTQAERTDGYNLRLSGAHRITHKLNALTATYNMR